MEQITTLELVAAVVSPVAIGTSLEVLNQKVLLPIQIEQEQREQWEARRAAEGPLIKTTLKYELLEGDPEFQNGG